MHKNFRSKNLKGRDHSVLEWSLGKLRGDVWTGWIWLRRGTSGGLLWTW